jgi:hypothetical protein
MLKGRGRYNYVDKTGLKFLLTCSFNSGLVTVF